MNKPVKVLLGIFTFLPLIIVISAVAFGFYHLLGGFLAGEPTYPFLTLFVYAAYIFPIALIFIALYLCLWVFYLIHLLQNRRMDTEKKILWIAVLFAFTPLSMPFYWWMYIWKNENDRKSEMNKQLRYESPGTES